MSMNSSERVVLIGLENADGSLNGALQVIETLSGLAVKAAGDNRERGVLRRSMSNSGSVVGAKNYDITLPVELKGGGLNAGVVQAPPMHAALIACGMIAGAGRMVTVSSVVGAFTAGEAVTNSTATNTLGMVLHSVTNTDGTQTLWINLENTPADSDALLGDTSAATATVDSSDDAMLYRLSTAAENYATCQIHTHMSKTRRIMSRGLASFSFDFKAGESASINFDVKGLYGTPTDEVLPSAVYNDSLPPIGENAGLTIKGYPVAGTIEKFSLKQGNQVVPVPDINSGNGRRSFSIQSRKPEGSIDPEVVELATFNPFTLWEDGTKAPIHCTLGDTAGERISVLVSAAQFKVPGDKSRAGNDAYELAFDVTGSDDDEMYLIFH